MRKIDLERQQAKRQQILKAARDCFARRGFHATSTAEICATAGMSPGNLFHYFNSKNAIIEAIVEEERQETATYFAQALAAPDPLGALLDFLDLIMTLAADDSYSRLALEIAAEAMRNPTVRALVETNDSETRAAIASLVKGAMAGRQIDADIHPEQAATWIAALIDGVFSRLSMDRHFDPERERPMLRLIVTRFLAAAKPA